jgi:hypothetical protein
VVRRNRCNKDSSSAVIMVNRPGGLHIDYSSQKPWGVLEVLKQVVDSGKIMQIPGIIGFSYCIRTLLVDLIRVKIYLCNTGELFYLSSSIIVST